MPRRSCKSYLRHQRFFSLNELNWSLRTLLADRNQRPFKKLPARRVGAFAEMDQSVLRALPERRYEYAEWMVVRVGVDYHVEVDGREAQRRQLEKRASHPQKRP